jgi:hypothetical protein
MHRRLVESVHTVASDRYQSVVLRFSPELDKINPVDTFKRVSRQRPIVRAAPARPQGTYVEYSALAANNATRMSLEELSFLQMKQAVTGMAIGTIRTAKRLEPLKSWRANLATHERKPWPIPVLTLQPNGPAQ